MENLPRTPAEYRAWWESQTDVPYGFCWCGCGERTNLAPQTQVCKLWVNGEPKRFIRGHRSRVGKVADQKLLAAYEQAGSIWKAAELLQISGQAAHRRLQKLGVEFVWKAVPEWKRQAIRDYYIEHAMDARGEFGLREFAESIGLAHTHVATIARTEGLADPARPVGQELRKQGAIRVKGWIAKNGHPRGALGMQHSPESKRLIGEASRAWWQNVTPEQLEMRRIKNLQTRQENGTLWNVNAGGGGYANVKRGHRDDLGFFVRSAWEANWTRYLMFLIENRHDPLEHFEYEPDTFWFDPIRWGVVSYTPDFKLYERDKELYYQEVKGRMDQKSRTKLKRMAKYHPEMRVDLIDEKAYREVERKLGAAIPNWEFAG